MTGRALVAAWAPAPVEALAEVERVAASSVSASDLSLIRDRVHSLLGVAASPLDDWRRSADLSARERALLGFVEQFVFSVSSLSDDEVSAVLAFDSPSYVHELCNAIWAIDLGTRLDLVAGAVLA